MRTICPGYLNKNSGCHTYTIGSSSYPKRRTKMDEKKDTGQGLFRTAIENNETERKAPLSAALCAKFRAQLTAELMDHVTLYAVTRAEMVANATGLHDPGRAEDLLQGAITDTLAGIVTWDGTIPLALHLRQV